MNRTQRRLNEREQLKKQKKMKKQTISFPILNVNNVRENFYDFVKSDKESGIKKAWYFTHIEQDQNQAIDTKEQLDNFIGVYKKQGIQLYKTKDVDSEFCKSIGIVSAKLMVFRGV